MKYSLFLNEPSGNCTAMLPATAASSLSAIRCIHSKVPPPAPSSPAAPAPTVVCPCLGKRSSGFVTNPVFHISGNT